MKKTLLAILISGIVLLVLSYFVMSLFQETKSLTNEDRSSAPGKFVELDHGIVHYALQGSDSAELIVFMAADLPTGLTLIILRSLW
jgi:hypothetical protein